MSGMGKGEARTNDVSDKSDKSDGRGDVDSKEWA
jgi:hypothetical protein